MIINSNVIHQYVISSPVLSILVSPFSPIGFSLSKYLNEESHVLFDSPFCKKIKNLADCLHNKSIGDKIFIDKIRTVLQRENDAGTDIKIDERIWKVLKFMKKNSESIIKANDAAKLCYLSESRFLHLFKQETNINFRHLQIWNKLIQAFPLFHQRKKISEIAHQCGFTDSAHFNKKFKEYFGFPPKYFKNNSYFIQF